MALLRLWCSPRAAQHVKQKSGSSSGRLSAIGTSARRQPALLGSGTGTARVQRQEAEQGQGQVKPTGLSGAKPTAGKLQHELQKQLRLRRQTTSMQVGCLPGHPPSPQTQQIQAGGTRSFGYRMENPSVLQLQSAE